MRPGRAAERRFPAGAERPGDQEGAAEPVSARRLRGGWGAGSPPSGCRCGERGGGSVPRTQDASAVVSPVGASTSATKPSATPPGRAQSCLSASLASNNSRRR